MLEIHLEKYLLSGKSWEKKEESRFSASHFYFYNHQTLEFYYIYIYRLLEPGIIKDVRRKIHEINREIRGV